MAGSRSGPHEPNEFSRRLSRALTASGLSLNRVQAKLAQRGQRVSTATLSYWSNGRSLPSRESSLDAITALESILELQQGALTSALDDTEPLQFFWGSERHERLRRAIREAQLPNIEGQRLLAVHYEAGISAEGHQASSQTSVALEARRPGARGWSITVDKAPEQSVSASAGRGVSVGRVIELDECATVFEFLLDEPLERGQCRRTVHRLDFGPGGPLTTRSGYALNRPLGLLVLTVRFEGEPPPQVWREFTVPGQDATTTRVERLASGPEVECVIPNPDHGLHAIGWEW